MDENERWRIQHHVSLNTAQMLHRQKKCRLVDVPLFDRLAPVPCHLLVRRPSRKCITGIQFQQNWVEDMKWVTYNFLPQTHQCAISSQHQFSLRWKLKKNVIQERWHFVQYRSSGSRDLKWTAVIKRMMKMVKTSQVLYSLSRLGIKFCYVVSRRYILGQCLLHKEGLQECYGSFVAKIKIGTSTWATKKRLIFFTETSSREVIRRA